VPWIGLNTPLVPNAKDHIPSGWKVTIWLFNIAMENGPFIDGLPVYLQKMVIFHGYVK